MSESVETLELRKQALLARSSLCRLRIAYEVTTIRESMRWPRIGLALAASPPARFALFDALELIVGRGRLAQVLRGAAFALALAKLARSAAAYFSAP
jgi:hypothetical protein